MLPLRPWGIALALVLAASAGRSVAESTPTDVPPVLLSRQLAAAADLEVGEVVRLSADSTGEDPRPFRVAGVYEPIPDPFRLTVRRLEARLHLPDLIELSGDPLDPLAAETVTRINVALEPAAAARDFARELERRVPGIVVRSTDRPRTGSDPFVVLNRFHAAIAAVTVIGSAAFLLALMVMRSEERRETAGILRLIGFSRPRILLEVFVEGLFVALAGSLAGVIIALAVEGLLNRFFQWHYDTALVFVHVTPGIAIRCIAISVPLGVLAGLAASWTLLRRGIMSLLHR